MASRKPAMGDKVAWIKWGTCFLVCLVGMGFGRYVYSLVLPVMQKDLVLGYGPMGFMSTANLLGYTSLSFLIGVFITRLGYRWAMALGLGLLSLTLLGLTYSSSYWLLLLLMFMAGAGTGSSYNIAMAYAASLFAADRRGLVLGMTTSGVSAGMVISGYLFPPIMAVSGWRTVWGVVAVISMAVMVVTIAVLKDDRNRVGVVLTPSLKQVSIYRNQRILGVALVYLLAGFFAVFVVFYPAFLARQLQYSSNQIGFLWSLLGFFSVVSLFFWGWLSDRVGRKLPLFIALILTSLAFLAAAASSMFPGPVITAISIILFGLCYSAPMGIIPATMADIAGPQAGPQAIGLASAFFGIGQAMAPSFAGFLTDATGNFSAGFLMGAIALVAAALIWVLVMNQTGIKLNAGKTRAG